MIERKEPPRHRLRFLVVLVGLTMAGELPAQDRPPGDVGTEASKIFSSVMSPFCPGRLLANCPSDQAEELRQWVRDELAAGERPSAIVDELFVRYGDAVRAAPRGQGFGAVAWVMPFLVLTGGVLATVIWLRRSAAAVGPNGTQTPSTPLDLERQARLDAELEKL